jgi:hypothetical protein
MRTSGCPAMVTEVDPPTLPIGSGYGTPETELTIWQMEPAVASGRPEAAALLCSTDTITPESGGPDAPGLRSTAQPMETGGPDIVVS